MARILGIDIPDNKRLDIALTYIYGIGRTTAAEMCKKLKIDHSLKARDLTPKQITIITKLLQDDYTIEGELKRSVQQNIKRLAAIKCYRGIRHRRGLPVKGQRTKTNARTRKGAKRTVGAIRDRAARKMSKPD
ncbi:MAG: 30S ribosomal protein S13 [Verrucomicrobiota bacterium]|nr:30S ribosomal protein S13 [Verrucomicrobiota bacterium]